MIKSTIKLLSILLLTVLLSCEKEVPIDPFVYDHSITIGVGGHTNFMQESDKYYYDENKRLLKDAQIYNSEYSSESPVTYDGVNIIRSRGTYTVGANGYVSEYSYDALHSTTYFYQGDKMISSSENIADQTAVFNLYFYENDNLIQDSITVIQNGGLPLPTARKYIYTDTLRPEFMIDRSGLYEFPVKSKYLPKEIIDDYSKLKYRYDYEITDNQIVQYQYLTDLKTGIEKPDLAIFYKIEKP